MSKKGRNKDCVTTSECRHISGSINGELVTIKKALVGDDMRGGMVKELADIKANLNNNNGGLGKKERVALYTSAIITTGLVIDAALKFFS